MLSVPRHAVRSASALILVGVAACLVLPQAGGASPDGRRLTLGANRPSVEPQSVPSYDLGASRSIAPTQSYRPLQSAPVQSAPVQSAQAPTEPPVRVTPPIQAAPTAAVTPAAASLADTSARVHKVATQRKRTVRVDAPSTRVAVRDHRVRVNAPHTRVAVDDGRVRVRAPYVDLDIRW